MCESHDHNANQRKVSFREIYAECFYLNKVQNRQNQSILFKGI